MHLNKHCPFPIATSNISSMGENVNSQSLLPMAPRIHFFARARPTQNTPGGLIERRHADITLTRRTLRPTIPTRARAPKKKQHKKSGNNGCILRLCSPSCVCCFPGYCAGLPDFRARLLTQHLAIGGRDDCAFLLQRISEHRSECCY